MTTLLFLFNCVRMNVFFNYFFPLAMLVLISLVCHLKKKKGSFIFILHSV